MKKTYFGRSRNLLGPRIRQIRHSLRPAVSQEDLCGRLAAVGIHLDRSAVSRLENGDRYLMDYELIAIAECLHVKASDILLNVTMPPAVQITPYNPNIPAPPKVAEPEPKSK